MDELSSDYKQKLFGSANFKYDYQLSQERRKFGKQVQRLNRVVATGNLLRFSGNLSAFHVISSKARNSNFEGLLFPAALLQWLSPHVR